MLESIGALFRRKRRRLRIAVVTPVGPGHADLYAECRASVQDAWRASRGPFSTLSFIAVDDSEGRLGRSRARNIGIDRAVAERADWLFFLDADDLMVESAFESVAPLVADHDAVWGLILGLAPGAAQPHLRIPQIIHMDTLEELLLFDPFLTLQMGHFVRTQAAASVRFDETMDAGEDFDYYLRLWSDRRCAKMPREFFINRHALHSTGPRSASAGAWGAAVRGRRLDECQKRGVNPEADGAKKIRNARAADQHAFCRQLELVKAADCIALSNLMPFHGAVEVDGCAGGRLLLHSENDDAICAQLAWTGEYQPFTAALWQVMAGYSETIMDASAGTGLFALLAARAAPRCRVFCFEAVAENCRRIRTNIELNGVMNIELVEAAVSKSNGRGYLCVPPSGVMLPLVATPGAATDRPVQQFGVDEFLADSGRGSIQLARIGGATDPLAVLAGMTRQLAMARPELIIELSSAALLGALTAELNNRAYRCYAVDNTGHTLRLIDGGATGIEDSAMQLLATVRAPDELGRIAAVASGRLIGA